MTDHYDDDRRAMARCEEHWLREPAWRTGNPDGCDVCGVDLPDDLRLCAACADARDDDDFSATPYATSTLPADDEDVIPIP